MYDRYYFKGLIDNCIIFFRLIYKLIYKIIVLWNKLVKYIYIYKEVVNWKYYFFVEMVLFNIINILKNFCFLC